MRGVSNIPFSYVSEYDRGLPTEEQTTFWLLQQTVKDSVEALSRYSKGISSNRVTGKDDVDINSWMGADKENFINSIDHIDNFFFDGENQGTDIKPEDIELKEKVFYQLPPQVLKELMDKVREPRVSIVDKKKSK
ncbi:MAG: hypothetical protein ACFE95_02645 [Candidatus Hodarchaeota archaeon]